MPVLIVTEAPKVILDEAITKLRPAFFWLGSGEIDLKLGVRTSEFIDFVKPFIVGVCFNNIIPVFHPNLTRSIRSSRDHMMYRERYSEPSRCEWEACDEAEDNP
ncbi:hypothetical protein YC2023_009766 [Brassica napus]